MKMGMQVHLKKLLWPRKPAAGKGKAPEREIPGPYASRGFKREQKRAFSKKAADFGFWGTYASAFGCGLLGKNGRFSMASTTSFKKAVTSKCCGQARSHCLQPMQSEALPWRRAMLL